MIVGDILYSIDEPMAYADLTGLVNDIRYAEHGLSPTMRIEACLTYDFVTHQFRISNPPTPPQRQITITNDKLGNLRFYSRTDYDKLFVTVGKEAGVAIDLKNNRIFAYDPLQQHGSAINKVISKLKWEYNPWFFNRIKVVKNKDKLTDSVDDFREYFFNTKMKNVEAFFRPIDPQPSFTPTYGDGNCGMNVFGEIDNGEYKWTKGNPREQLIDAIQNRNTSDVDLEYLLELAITAFKADTSRQDATEDDYLKSLKSSSHYLDETEIQLFAILVAKKNFVIHADHNEPVAHELGYDQTIHLRHTQVNKSVNDIYKPVHHWERIEAPLT